MVKDLNAVGFKLVNNFQVVVDDTAAPADRTVVETSTDLVWIGQNAVDCFQLRVLFRKPCGNPPAFFTAILENVGSRNHLTGIFETAISLSRVAPDFRNNIRLAVFSQRCNGRDCICRDNADITAIANFKNEGCNSSNAFAGCPAHGTDADVATICICMGRAYGCSQGSRPKTCHKFFHDFLQKYQLLLAELNTNTIELTLSCPIETGCPAT